MNNPPTAIGGIFKELSVGLKLFAIGLTAIVFGDRINEFNPSRILINSNTGLYKLFDFFGKLLRLRKAFTQDDECLWLDQSFGLMANNSTFKDGFVLQ